MLEKPDMVCSSGTNSANSVKIACLSWIDSGFGLEEHSIGFRFRSWLRFVSVVTLVQSGMCPGGKRI